MDRLVYCEFKHIPSKRDGDQIAANIKTFIKPKRFDESGIKKCGQGGNDTICFQLTREEANRLRDNLSSVLSNDNSPVWFHIVSNPLHSLIPHTLATTDDIQHAGSTFDVACQFGSLRSYNQFYSHVQFDNKVVKVSFKILRRIPNAIHIDFDNIRIIIPFKLIQKQNILVNKENSKYGVYVLLPLKYLPNIFRMEPVKGANKADQNAEKQCRLCGDESSVSFMREIVHCSDVVFHFPPSQDMPWMFLTHFLIDRAEQYHINFSGFKICDWSKENNRNSRPNPFDYRNAPFQDRYGLELLISLGYVFRDKWAQLTDQELNWQQWNPSERYSMCCFVVEQLKLDHAYDLIRTTSDYNEKKKKSNSDINDNGELVADKQRLKIACCTLTPLKIIFQPLEITIGSRALRLPEFGGAERFLLVHFRDEDNRQLRGSNRNIQQRLKNSMQNGISLFNKTFKYMGASTGQMKEMAFWFIDLPRNIRDITEAHQKLGTFDQIKNIATYIARVGQYFSTTRPVDIRLTHVENKNDIRPNGIANYAVIINDIKRNDYCFTDGVGKISLGLAGRVAQKLSIPICCQEDIPSAFQVRVAGCKGMVAIDPESTLNDYYIHVRDSMVKFPSDDWNLEICEFSRPMTLTLNNQVIRLLSDLGNADGQFIAFQNQGFGYSQTPEEQESSAIDIAVQKNMSYSLSKDNLLTNRIPIPPTDGRNLFGIADETGELQYGQCFIQYSALNQTNKGRRKFHVVTGTVLVTKNPCLWPGDFRRLTAVHNSTLEKFMRDVIVFPINGQRPHSNEIAGSDLDGDQYWVYWGDRFTIEQHVEPLSYTGAKKIEVSSITPEIIIDHIIKTFSSGIILGMIANTHTVVADKHPQHSFSVPCKKLAELFSLAVDSPKTGHFIDKEEIRPFQKEYCRDWPEFMRKYDEPIPIPPSNSILEKLFKNAESKYHEWKEKPIANRFPPPNRAIKFASANTIENDDFKAWLSGSIYKRDANPRKPSKTPSNKLINEDPSIAHSDRSTESPTTTNEKLEPVTRKNQRKKLNDNVNQPETPIEPTSEPTVTNKKAAPETRKNQRKKLNDNVNRPETPIEPTSEPTVTNEKAAPETRKNQRKKLNDTVNRPETPIEPKSEPKATKNNSSKTEITARTRETPSASSATSASAASSIVTQYQTDFVMAGITNAGAIQCTSIAKNYYIVDSNKSTPENFSKEEIINKIESLLDKEDVFKKSPSAYNQAIHGSLYLIVYYGHIYFIEQDSYPSKLGQLKEIIKNKGDEFIRFNHANIDELNVSELSKSTTRKNKIGYEFDCRVTSSPSKYFTVLYDESKKLRQIRVYHIWSKYFVRESNFNADTLYEIRSALTYDECSLEFTENMRLIFKSQSTELLSGRKPNIKIDRSILCSSVIPIGLKILEEDQADGMNQSTTESSYRIVRYVPIDEQQTKPNVLLTMEYHVSPISKKNGILAQVCNSAFIPTEQALLIRGQAAASTNNSWYNSLPFEISRFN
ncbi:unnamed protein product [Rotaria magnacalcarata]|uniref:RNA-dependent RNA polymerase n=2 Tax=Rotaria magnacalcarata TaxID=392030 RepID=A0A815C8K7_9BILA|nr:unnamed protein product [Rotaria magnacalcarata]CAF2107605.1 unnamed protein product [Rotaria magnacalcarata]